MNLWPSDIKTYIYRHIWPVFIPQQQEIKHWVEIWKYILIERMCHSCCGLHHHSLYLHFWRDARQIHLKSAWSPQWCGTCHIYTTHKYFALWHTHTHRKTCIRQTLALPPDMVGLPLVSRSIGFYLIPAENADCILIHLSLRGGCFCINHFPTLPWLVWRNDWEGSVLNGRSTLISCIIHEPPWTSYLCASSFLVETLHSYTTSPVKGIWHWVWEQTGFQQ